MGRINDSVKDGVGHCRITSHVIPVGRWVLRGYDSGFPFMPVLNDFEQDTRVRDKKELVKVGNLANILYLYG